MNDHAATHLTYESGDWYGVVGPRVVVVLPPAEKARVAAIWTLADDGADLDETLDALIASGLRSLSGFVLVGHDSGTSGAGETRVVLRGAASVSVTAGGETVVLDGGSASTWVERSLHDVQSLVIDVAEVVPGAPSHSIEQGLVRVARLTRGAPVTAAGPADHAEVPTEPSLEAAPTPPPFPAPGEDAGAAAVVVAPVAPSVPFDDVFDTDPVPADGSTAFDSAVDPEVGPQVDAGVAAEGGLWSPTPVEPAAADAYSSAPVLAAPLPDPFGENGDDPTSDPLADPLTDPFADARGAGTDVDRPDDEGSDVGPLGGDQLDDQPTETFAATSSDHDGQTQFSPFDDEEIQLVRPGIPGQPPAPPVTARPVARLVIAGGETIDVDRAILLGRTPTAGRAGGTDEPLLVTVDSPHQEVSSTHVEIRPGSGADHGTAVVTDLGSTNGTIVTQPGLEAEELQPGLSVQLIPGAVIDLGDGVTIQVTRP